MPTNNPKVQVAQARWRFTDPETGDPAAGYKVFTYEPGTTTKLTTYSDPNGLTPNTNPIILDANGECDIYVEPLTPFSVDTVPAGPPGPVGPPGSPGPPGATGNTAEYSYIVDIDSETIYNSFYDEFIEIVPAQGSGIAIIPVMIVINYHYRTSFYDVGAAEFVLYWGPPLLPTAVPFSNISAAMMEAGTDKLLFFPGDPGLYGSTIDSPPLDNAPLTISLDEEPVGPPLIAIYVNAPGEDYVIGDTGVIDTGDGLAEYEVVTVDVDGAVTEITLTAGGTGYSNDLDVATSTDGSQPGVGTGLTLDIISAETTSGTLRVTTYYRKLILTPA